MAVNESQFDSDINGLANAVTALAAAYATAKSAPLDFDFSKEDAIVAAALKTAQDALNPPDQGNVPA